MRYDLAAIRELVSAAFSDEELRTFCFDHYHAVYEQFAVGQSKGAWVLALVEHADKHGMLDQLLAQIKTANPHKYEVFESRLCVQLPDLGTCPYRGLEYFDVPHAGDYFGREAMVAKLLDRLGDTNFVAVVGPSGCGKSSLVRAGLIPALQRGALPGSEGWDVDIFRPGDDPLRSLALPLAARLAPDLSPVDRLAETRKLAEHLAAGTVPIGDVLAQLRQQCPGLPRLVLIADQFEEAFTLCGDEKLRQALFSALLQAAETPWLTVILTLRADFFGRALADGRLGPRVDRGLVNVLPMTAAERRAAIEQPALRAGRAFEEGLVERILEAVEDAPGDLPLLEFALTELWARQTAEGLLTHSAYEAIGEVRGAIAQRADSTLAGFNPDQQDVVRTIFMRLVQVARPAAGTEDTKRRINLEELTPQTAALAQQLADARLLVAGRDPDSGEETIEVAHEALIRGWQQLRDWLNSDREFLLWRQRLRTLADIWHGSGRSEGALLRDTLLREAQVWWEERAGDLGALEVAFIDASHLVAERVEKEKAASRQRELQQAQALAQSERVRAEEQARSAKRLRGLAIVLSLVLAVALLAAAYANGKRKEADTYLAVAQARTGDAIASQATSEAERNRAELQKQLATSRALVTSADYHASQQLDLALLLSLEANRIEDTIDSRSTLFRTLLRYPDIVGLLRGHSAPITDVAYSPNGQMLATSSRDRTVMVWDVQERRAACSPLMGHTGMVGTVAFAPDGRTLASGGEDKNVVLWDVTTCRQVGSPFVGHTGSVNSVSFSPDGSMLASSSRDHTIILWDLATHQSLGAPLVAHTDWVYEIAFSPDGTTLASGSADRSIVLWDTDTKKPIGPPLLGHTGKVYGVAFRPDGEVLASSSEDGTIILWSLDTREPLSPRIFAGGVISGLAFSPDGMTLASGNEDQTIELWNLAASPLSSKKLGNFGVISGLAFSPDGKGLASSGTYAATLWNLSGERRLSESLHGHSDWVYDATFSPDGQTLASSGSDGTIILWNVAEKRAIATFTNESQATTDKGVVSLDISPDGRTLAAGGNGVITLWDLKSQQRIGAALAGYSDWVRDVAFSPSGSMLAGASYDGQIILWDVVNHRPVGEPIVLGQKVYSVAFSPDGRALAAGLAGGRIILWDAIKREPLGNPLEGHSGDVMSVRFGVDGKTLVSGGLDGRVILWDFASRKPIGEPMTGHAGWVMNVALSHDGKMLASGSNDGAIRLWDPETHLPIGVPLMGHQTAVASVEFNRTDSLLVSASWDGTLMLWETSLDSWKNRACALANRDLTPSEWDMFLGSEDPYRPTCSGLYLR